MIRKLRAWGKLANALTITRIVLFPVPLVMLLIDHTSVEMRLMTTATFIVIILTDQLDGHIARKWKQVTDFGKLWDPLADKLLMVTTMFGMCLVGIFLPPWGWIYLAYTFVREVGVTIWRAVRAPDVIIPADWWGKMKTYTLAVAFGMMLLPLELILAGSLLLAWWAVITVLLTASLIGSVVSGYHYIRQ